MRVARTTEAPSSIASRACAGPASDATARARTRSATKAEGVVPSGGTRPFDATSTALRSPTRAPISPTAAGRELHGTASTTRSTPANSTSRTAHASIAAPSGTPGR